MSRPDFDVVIVGGGIAGGALALRLARAGRRVLLLERQKEHRDVVRGEMLAPWGVAEADLMGITDALYRAHPAPLRSWVQWDEIYDDPAEAPTIDLTRTLVPGVDSPLTIFHYETCRRLVEAAGDAGADVRMGVSAVEVEAGANPGVTFAGSEGATPSRVSCRMVIGAGGRAGPVGRQIGVSFDKRSHHWGGGLAVEGLDEWPAGVQAMGTEGDRMFYVFPQTGGRARLYLNYSAEHARKFNGPDRAERFLREFQLACLPYSEMVLGARPIGPCANIPGASTTTARPFVDGVVLVGDEAGYNDPILGTGLSNSLRDARMVSDVLLGGDDWSPSRFEFYAEERTERLRRLIFSADLLSRLSAEFGPGAVERRRRAWERMRENPNYMIPLQVVLSGPDNLPAVGFSDFLAERLFGEKKESKRVKGAFLARVGA